MTNTPDNPDAPTRAAGGIEKHVTLLGVLYIAFGATGLLAASIVFLAIVGGGFLSGDETAMFITSTVGTAIASLIAFLSLPGLVGAYGLLKRRNWGRFLVLIVSAMNLLIIPFGTALGIYAFWVLTQDEASSYFSRK